MSYFRTMDIGASALTAQTLRIETISQNIANSQTTRTEDGLPYRRKMVVMQEAKQLGTFEEALESAFNRVHAGAGVRVARVVEDPSALKRVYEPEHPDADEEGYVLYPNVNPVVEMVNLISATRGYEANVTTIQATKSMALKALEIGR
jgi:flagellar basal-body rod protein FlgC